MIVQPRVGDIARLFYRRKWTAIFVALVVAALGAAYLITAVPVYRSDAMIVVRFNRTAVPATNLAKDSTPFVVDTNDRRDIIQAHADILTSPDLAQTILTRIGVANLYPDLAKDPPPVGTEMDAAVRRFEGSLFVSPELTGTVIRVAFSHTNPQVAQEVLKVTIEEYMERESQIFSDTNYAFQKAQAEVAYNRLTAAQKDLSSYKASSEVSDFDAQMSAMIKQESDLRARLHMAQVGLAESSQKRDALTQLLQTVPATVNVASDKYRQVDEAQARLSDLRAREREMIAAHGTSWPALAGLRASIAEVQGTASTSSAASNRRSESRPSEVHQNIQTDLLRATAEAESNQQAVALMTDQEQRLRQQIDALEAKRGGLLERQRQVDLADSAYRSMVMHVEDSRIGQSVLRDGISRVAVITKPNLPYSAAHPRYRLMAIATAAAAVLSGLMVAFLLELLDDRFISGRQVAVRLNVPVLATFDK